MCVSSGYGRLVATIRGVTSPEVGEARGSPLAGSVRATRIGNLAEGDRKDGRVAAPRELRVEAAGIQLHLPFYARE